MAACARASFPLGNFNQKLPGLFGNVVFMTIWQNQDLRTPPDCSERRSAFTTNLVHVKRECKTRSEGPLPTPLNLPPLSPPASGGESEQGESNP